MLMFTCIFCDVRETGRTELPVNVSFAASKKSLNTNENSLETSLSAVKFRSNYHRVPWNFAWIFAERHVISLELSRSAVKYRCRSNNRTREISLKNRSKRNFAYYRRIFTKFAELRLHYFCTILYMSLLNIFITQNPFGSKNPLDVAGTHFL